MSSDLDQTPIRHRLRLAVWKVRTFIHALREPLMAGDSSLGPIREERDQNIRLMSERWWSKAPRRPEA